MASLKKISHVLIYLQQIFPKPEGLKKKNTRDSNFKVGEQFGSFTFPQQCRVLPSSLAPVPLTCRVTREGCHQSQRAFWPPGLRESPQPQVSGGTAAPGPDGPAWARRGGAWRGPALGALPRPRSGAPTQEGHTPFSLSLRYLSSRRFAAAFNTVGLPPVRPPAPGGSFSSS